MQRVREREVREEGNTTSACGVLRGGQNKRFAASGGFTLTEVLIVAVIIGILLALVSAAVFPALDSAKEFTRYSEAANLSMAMESFKAQYGATPPADLTNTSSVTKFFARAFPRASAPDLSQISSVNSSGFDPGNALVFWLVGFSGDPSNPLTGHEARMRNGGGDGEPFYEFDTERLSGASSGTVRYYPNLPGGEDIYNADSDGAKAFLYYARPYSQSTNPNFTPYQKEGTTDYYNPRSFQIIQAGLDNALGSGGPLTATGSIDDDNIASFASGTVRDFYEKNN